MMTMDTDDRHPAQLILAKRDRNPGDVFYSDSPRFLNNRYLASTETIVSSLQHPLCVCPAEPVRPASLRRAPVGKNANARDFAWLLQKLTGKSFDTPKMTETVVLAKGKPLKIFFHKDGKLQCKHFSASAELFIIMRKWFATVVRRLPDPSPQQKAGMRPVGSVEVCSLQFNDGAVRTLAERELEEMLRQRKPKRSQWIDTKCVQLLPNAGCTFDRPLKYITYHFDEKLSSEKHNLAKEMRSTPGDNEVKVEEAIWNIQKLLDPLFIAQGDFAFAQMDTVAGESAVLYLLWASNLVVSQRREQTADADKTVDTDVKYINDASFLKSIENRTPTNKMAIFLGQLDEFYENRVRTTASPPNRRASNESIQSPSPRSFPSAALTQQPYFSVEPPVCPPSPRKPNFILPPRPKSVGDLLGTSSSSTWFQRDQRARQMNSRPNRSLAHPLCGTRRQRPATSGDPRGELAPQRLMRSMTGTGDLFCAEDFGDVPPGSSDHGRGYPCNSGEGGRSFPSQQRASRGGSQSAVEDHFPRDDKHAQRGASGRSSQGRQGQSFPSTTGRGAPSTTSSVRGSGPPSIQRQSQSRTELSRATTRGSLSQGGANQSRACTPMQAWKANPTPLSRTQSVRSTLSHSKSYIIGSLLP